MYTYIYICIYIYILYICTCVCVYYVKYNNYIYIYMYTVYVSCITYIPSHPALSPRIPALMAFTISSYFAGFDRRQVRSTTETSGVGTRKAILVGSMEEPSGDVKIAIENGDLYWIYPLKMVIYSGKWWFILDLSIKNGDFPELCYVVYQRESPLTKEEKPSKKRNRWFRWWWFFRFRGNDTFITNPCPLISHTPKKPWYWIHSFWRSGGIY